MHRRRARAQWSAWCGWLLWGLISHLPWAAHAQSTPPPTTAAPSGAYEHFIEDALQAYDAGRFAEARTSFRRAHELTPTARTLRTIGMCSFNLGDYADAAWNLERARAETRKPLNEEQQRHASELITRANQRIGRFRLRLDPAEAALLVDGQAPLLLDNELLLESGRHQIEARALGRRSTQTTLNVEGGDRTTLVLHLTHDTAVAVAAPTGASADTHLLPAAAASPQPVPTDSASTQTWLGYSSLGLGVAGLIGFGVVSGLALAEKDKLDERCPDGTCRNALRDDVERYDALRMASTVTLIAGGTLTVFGAVLLLTRPNERAERAAIEPLLGPGMIGVRGRL